MKFNIQTILIALLLIVSLIVRLSYLEYPLIHSSKWGDGTRDYLVAHYIRSYKEIPMLGPFNLLFNNGLRNSPLYFYLLAIFLLPYDNVMTLGFVNILFQMATILLIYLLTKKIFDQGSALLTALLFSLSPTILSQTEYIWQPYLMQPFALLSLYLLSLAYFKRNYKILIISLVMLILATTLSYAVFPWFPQFLLICFWILKLQKKSFKYYFGLIFAGVIFLILFYLPVVIYFLHGPSNSQSLAEGNLLYLQSFNNYLNNLSYNFYQLFQAFSFNSLLIILFISLILIFLALQNGINRWVLIFGILFFLEPILVSSLFNKNQLHYLTASFGLFVIIFSVTFKFLFDKLISKFVKNKFFYISCWMISILLLLKIFTQDFKFVYPVKEHIETEDQIRYAVSIIERQVLRIKTDGSFPNVDFFQVISFASDKKDIFRYPTLDTIILVPLEKSLKVKLAKIDDDSPFNLVQVNDEAYIFLTCFEFDWINQVKDCTKTFSAIYPQHLVVRNIYNQYPISIYLAKR